MPLYLDVVALGIDDAQNYMKRVDKYVVEENEKRVKRSTIRLEGQVKREASGGTVGGPLSRTRGPRPGSGKLAQSWTHGFERTRDDFIGRTGSSSIYARIHEMGGEVRAKSVKFLTIPLTERAARTRAREMNLDFIVSRAGNYLLIDAESGEPQYLLRRSVEIPARAYVSKAVLIVRPEIDRDLNVTLDAAMKRAE